MMINVEEDTFQMFFAMKAQVSAELPKNYILVFPADDDWNDFGYQTLFDFSVVFHSEEVFSQRFHLAFQSTGELSQSSMIVEHLNLIGSDVIECKKMPPFFSMQLDLEKYEKLVQEFGVGGSHGILKVLNDLVLGMMTPPIQEWVEQATQSNVFNLSFIRFSNGFNAYFKGAQVLAGNIIKADRPPAQISFDFHLAQFENEHEFNFQFERSGLLPKRIAVIVGKNGVGKSRTLNQLVSSILEGHSNVHDGTGKPLKLGMLLAVCTPGETDATFPSTESNTGSVEYRRLQALPGQRVQDGAGTMPLILQQLARSDADFGPQRWDIFKRSVSTFLPFSELAIIPRKLSEGNPIPAGVHRAIGAIDLEDLYRGGEKSRLQTAALLDRNGTLVRRFRDNFLPLSSGQLSFIRLAAQLCLYITPGSVVLIDEPETHLHPNLITDFAALLNEVLAVADSIAIIATHSAYVVREVPTSQVHLIQVSDDNSVKIGRPRIKTFGADVGTISNFIFDDGFMNRLTAELDHRIREEGLQIGSWLETLKGELSDESIMYLKRQQDKTLREDE